MAGWDGDALAGSMEEALERQQQAAEARRARKDTSSAQERERQAQRASKSNSGVPPIRRIVLCSNGR
jgi:hypothetical protein